MITAVILICMHQRTPAELGWKPIAITRTDAQGELAFERGPLHVNFKAKSYETASAAKEANRLAGSTNQLQTELRSAPIEKVGLRLYDLGSYVRSADGKLLSNPSKLYIARGVIGKTYYEIRCKNLKPMKPVEIQRPFEELVVSLVTRSASGRR